MKAFCCDLHVVLTTLYSIMYITAWAIHSCSTACVWHLYGATVLVWCDCTCLVRLYPSLTPGGWRTWCGQEQPDQRRQNWPDWHRHHWPRDCEYFFISFDLLAVLLKPQVHMSICWQWSLMFLHKLCFLSHSNTFGKKISPRYVKVVSLLQDCTVDVCWRTDFVYFEKRWKLAQVISRSPK